jgi:ABC-2 type transport system ATP-binding protein
MDEAERCTRLAILDHGRIAADGAPRELLANLPGRVWIIEADNLRRVQHALEGADHVRSLAQIGATLRVLSDDSDAAEAAINARLHELEQAARLQRATPNLEDVFVLATLDRRAEAAAA